MFRLDGKVAFVTGAARGMGTGIVEALAAQGATVIMTGRANNIFDAAETIKGDIEPLVLDVSDEAAVERMGKHILEKYKHVDILVNNAGLMKPVSARTMETELLDIHYNVNVRGTWFCTRAFFPQMMDQRYGRIINLSSITGNMVVDAGMMAYGMSKGAIQALTRGTAIEGAPYGVTANCIFPGYIRTIMVQNTADAFAPEDPELFFKKVAAGIPMGRLGTGLEVGYLAAFLASDEAGYITGAEYIIDGGQTLPETLALTGPYGEA